MYVSAIATTQTIILVGRSDEWAERSITELAVVELLAVLAEI